VAHSMGGLVVKKVSSFFAHSQLKAIIDAHNNAIYTNILENAKGIVFIGTPHRGADFANILSNLLTATFSEKIFVDQLRANSEMIMEINRAFRDRSLSMELVSFWESTATRGIGVILSSFAGSEFIDYCS
jgi:hypothetical protein